MNNPALARSLTTLLSMGALLASAPLYAADDTDLATQWRAECKRVNSSYHRDDYPLPKDMPDGLEYCIPEEMYYSAKADPHATQLEWNRVRACATMRDDDNVLLMMYFNGFGVKRSYDGAMYHACNLYQARLANDAGTQNVMSAMLLFADEDTPELDTCEGASVQLQINLCASWREAGAERAYEIKLDAIGRRMTAAQKAAFEALRAAAGGYAAACGQEENDVTRGGSGNPAFTIGATAAARDRFLAELEQAERGEFPRYTPDYLANSDRTLNETYRASMHDAPAEYDPDSLDGGETKQTLRDAQRAWLKYRDAWVTFAKLRYPNVPDYAWKARLTDQRLEWLVNPQ